MNDLRDLYEEMILEHNRHPRNYPKKPAGCNHSAHGFNPLCGDEFQVHATVRDGLIEDIGFEGAGCAISTASASMMTDAVKGKPLAEAEALFARVHQALTHEDDAGAPNEDIGKLAVLTGVREYPMRVKCATLAWHVLHAALQGKADTVCTE
jgi:nitrogen fixation NifU-like protein